MKVKEIMTTQVVTIPVTASRYQAAALLREHEISGLPVVDETNPRKVMGYLGRADILAARSNRHDEEERREKILLRSLSPGKTRAS